MQKVPRAETKSKSPDASGSPLCDYGDPSDICHLCSSKGYTCGPKTFGSPAVVNGFPTPPETGDAHVSGQLSAPSENSPIPTGFSDITVPIHPDPWQLGPPILPKIFQHFSNDPATRFGVLDQLANELLKIEESGVWKFPSPNRPVDPSPPLYMYNPTYGAGSPLIMEVKAPSSPHFIDERARFRNVAPMPDNPSHLKTLAHIATFSSDPRSAEVGSPNRDEMVNQ